MQCSVQLWQTKPIFSHIVRSSDYIVCISQYNMHSEQNSHTNFENPKSIRSLCNVPCSYSHHHRPSTQHFKSNRNVYHTLQLACWRLLGQLVQHITNKAQSRRIQLKVYCLILLITQLHASSVTARLSPANTVQDGEYDTKERNVVGVGLQSLTLHPTQST